MSNEISCKKCGYENPHSSKFCNNCGAKLPLSTHIICPNCATPNTRDRIFCDTCGTRLVAEPTPPQAEEPPEEPPTPSEPFSLPVRRPGETGELNPSAVPDWLRTGNIDDDAPEDDESKDESKKDAGDLPDWLVHDSDPEPIINAPTTISTEFYQDLLEKAEDLPQPDDLFADEEADLPDWLSEAKDVAAAADTDSEAASGLTDWLGDLDDSSEDAETAEPDEAASGGLTDWLHELDDAANPAEDHAAENVAALDNLLTDLPNEENEEAAPSDDWLAELGPAQTDIIAPQTDDLDTESDEELPGWMDELGPLQTNLLDPSQIARLTGPLLGMEDAAEIVDDEEAGADISFTSLFETASEETETLPEWLDAATQEGDALLTDLPEETADLAKELDIVSEADSDWVTADQIVAETDLDWLTETGDLDSAAADDSLENLELADVPIDETATDDILDELAADADVAIDADSADAVPTSDDDLDWLADLESIRTGKLVIEETEPEETAVVPDEPAEPEPEQPEEPVVQESKEAEWGSDSSLEETAVSQDLPEWLGQLEDSGQPKETAETGSPTSDSADEALPEWIASMRPSEGFIGSELPGVFSEADIRDTLEGIPEELAGAELPDWLQGTPLDGAPSASLADADKEETLDIPDWLQPKESEADTAVPTPSSVTDLPESSSSRDEWRSLLEELPPLTPLAESLPKADIPEWVQQLKPTELSGEPPRKPEGPEETAGPLKGMQGIVPIEPAIARPRSVLPLDAFGITPEQQQQVALLHQLTQETTETVTMLSTKTAYGTAVWLRVVLAALLIAALFIGLRGPNLVATDRRVPADVQAVQTAVSAAAGQPVLVAIEYTPAMAGELSPQAEMLLAQLVANGSPVLITSQYAAGTAVASSLIGDTNAQMVGYLPGESIGLRQLADCLAQRTECKQLNGRLLSDDLQAALPQTQLIIVLTGDRDNLVNWVEQVGSVATDIPIVAGVTQALAPLARSYTSTDQLHGLLGGIPDAVTYEQLNNLPKSNMQAQLNAQIIGQLLAAVLLLVGLLAYGTKGLLDKRQEK